MDYPKWVKKRWSQLNEYKEFEGEFIEDARARLNAAGLHVALAMPNMWFCGIVVTNESETKWIHVTIQNVQQNPEWFNCIRLRRMSSARDWKGDAFHITTYDNMIDDIIKYMGDEYDDEVL